jgi:alanine dehydrogenase
MKIGIIREGKIPQDKRVPFTPVQCKFLLETYSDLKIAVQPCTYRCYTDDEYKLQGVTLQDDLSDCDILMGVKEVPVENLISGKKYLFFSHTIKKQPYNKKLLQAVLKNNIQLID